jgi:hypothetical protein
LWDVRDVREKLMEEVDVEDKMFEIIESLLLLSDKKKERCPKNKPHK